MSKKTIGIIVGSARKNAFTKSIANAILENFPSNYDVSIIPIAHLALFNQDYDSEGTTPEAWNVFRQTIRSTDAFIFVTPEYNRSIPPLLKNAIDIGSYPYMKNNWQKKPAAIVGASPGSMGAFGAVQHLRQVFSCVDIYTMPQPEVYINHVASSLNKDGSIANEDLQKLLNNAIDSFIQWLQNFDV